MKVADKVLPLLSVKQSFDVILSLYRTVTSSITTLLDKTLRALLHFVYHVICCYGWKMTAFEIEMWFDQISEAISLLKKVGNIVLGIEAQVFLSKS